MAWGDLQGVLCPWLIFAAALVRVTWGLMPFEPKLFVYGTLLPDDRGAFGAAERTRLAAEADLIGAATTRGLLADLGDYPGLIGGNGLVHGAVYRLRDPARTLAWLDDYEGVTGAAGDTYARETRSITLSTGAIVMCWSYCLVQPIVDCTLIVSGRWCLRSSGPAA